MSDDVYMDYEILPTCQYPVDLFTRPDKQISCERPSAYRVYWVHEDGFDTGEMFVCQKHFDFMVEREKNQANG